MNNFSKVRGIKNLAFTLYCCGVCGEGGGEQSRRCSSGIDLMWDCCV